MGGMGIMFSIIPILAYFPYLPSSSRERERERERERFSHVPWSVILRDEATFDYDYDYEHEYEHEYE